MKLKIPAFPALGVPLFLALILGACVESTPESHAGPSHTSLMNDVSPREGMVESGKPLGRGPMGGMRGPGGPDKSADAQLQIMIAEVKNKFRTFEYTDAETGLTLPYNLYIPKGYSASSPKSFPLVLFIADSSVVGRDLSAPLTQGYGGLVWATEKEQNKHASFVLVPEYPEVILDDHGGYTMTDYVELTARFLKAVIDKYPVDLSRVYGTGQSMGCMTLMYLSAQYPDLLTAELFVSGQWDVNTLKSLAFQNFFYIVAEGDPKASQGQRDLYPVLNDQGVAISRASWDATWSQERFSDAVAKIVKEGNAIHFVTLKKGSVLPEGTPVGTIEHMFSFDYVYRIEALRDWLFAQTKTDSRSPGVE